ncbi:protein FAM3A isoform X4 [Phyllopteryx taeniolatus]|uniref:protein FAM3A isoform X4 n=1 Tax=Phyllopteryx taeniolatus TaxID=161469 RepID=UPI002AD48D28|nr:protein FAM3A isoform X4 [Phyllopteryx taeniolatus]
MREQIMRLTGPMRAVAALLLVGLTWLLASTLFGGESVSFVRHFLNSASQEPTAGVTGEPLETKTFDMWAGDVSDLLKYLRPLHEGTLVFVASFDDPATKLNAESRRLFEELGSTAVKELAFRDSWVFVGAKGIENKSPFEQRMKNSKSSNKYEGWPESLEMDGCIPLRPPVEV